MSVPPSTIGEEKRKEVEYTLGSEDTLGGGL